MCGKTPFGGPVSVQAVELTNDSIREKEAQVKSIQEERAKIQSSISDIKKIKEGGDGERIIHKVKNGEYLGKIASKYRVSVSQIKKWNNLKSNNIRVGQRLVIYRGGGGPSTSSSSSSTTAASSSSSFAWVRWFPACKVTV